MVRFLASTVMQILANAVGLIAASVIIDGFSLSGLSFVVALLIFSVAQLILGPFIAKVALKNAPFLMGGISLVTILVSLLIANIFSDGISINGLGTWVMATFIVWLFTVIAGIVLPLFLFKKTLQAVKDNNPKE